MESNQASNPEVLSPPAEPKPERIFRINFASIVLIILIFIPFVFLLTKKEEVKQAEAPALNEKQVLEQLKAETQKNPSYSNYINLSLQFYKAGEYENCVTACKEAVRLNPSSPIAYNNMCSAYNALQKYDQAIQACNAALTLDPNFQLAKTNLDYSERSKKALEKAK